MACTASASSCCNPLATFYPVDDIHPAVTHAAAVTVCGLATKLGDDSHDERGLRKLLSKSGSALISPAVGKAIARFNTTSFPTASVIRQLADQEHHEATSPIQVENTRHRHTDFLGLETTTGEKKNRKGKRPKNDKDGGCCNHCDCCNPCDCASPKRGTGGSCFDCGPGDSGCIDCCPCDGCDCCPCN